MQRPRNNSNENLVDYDYEMVLEMLNFTSELRNRWRIYQEAHKRLLDEEKTALRQNDTRERPVEMIRNPASKLPKRPANSQQCPKKAHTLKPPVQDIQQSGRDQNTGNCNASTGYSRGENSSSSHISSHSPCPHCGGQIKIHLSTGSIAASDSRLVPSSGTSNQRSDGTYSTLFGYPVRNLPSTNGSSANFSY